MLAKCKEHGIVLQGWSLYHEESTNVLKAPAIQKAAAAHNVSARQVALRWMVQRGVSIITDTASESEVESDLAIFGFELTDDEIDAISALNTHRGEADLL